MINKLFLFSLSLFLCLSAEEKPSYEIEGMWFGFFGNFNIVIGALEEYESNKIAGLKVNFDKNHCYFDEKYGPNWWDYYFYPLAVGNQKNLQKPSNETTVRYALRARWHIPIRTAKQLIDKYIRIKPNILKKVDDFYLKHFNNNYVIGVHYRGTDKLDPRYAEAHSISYNYVIRIMKKTYLELINQGINNIIFFISTDEQGFIDVTQRYFPNNICFQDEIRSTTLTPPHNMKTIENYTKGVDALTNSLLLSKTSLLIRTSSNLSATSCYFNPQLKVMNLNYPDSILFYKNRLPLS